MNVDYNNLSTQSVPLSNCVTSDREGAIITLHPEMVIPDDLQGKDFAFPFLHEMFRIRHEDPTFSADMENTSHPAERAIAEWNKSGRLPPGVAHDWKFAKTVWSLFLKGRHDVCSDYIKREHANYRFDYPPHPFVVIYAFCAKLGRRRAKDVFDVLQAEWGKAGTVDPKQRDTLREYFLNNHALDFWRGTWSVISEYMANFSEFSQVLIYLDRGVSIGSGYNPSSSAFDSTKMLYGNAYEHLAEFLTLPACLNNIVESRPYDTFEKLSLEQYLNLDKGSRHGPLKGNSNLYKLADALDNHVRNASHHGNMRFNSDTGDILYQRRKGRKISQMKYAEYLMLCNNIVQTIAGLVCFLVAELQPEEPIESK